jgi:cardiolipin synthase
MPLWFVLVAVVRDIMIVGGAFLYKKTTKKLYISPPFYGKTNTALQMLLLVVIFFNNGYGIEINEYYLLLITAFSTIVSGAMYVAEWGKKGYKLIYQ